MPIGDGEAFERRAPVAPSHSDKSNFLHFFSIIGSSRKRESSGACVKEPFPGSPHRSPYRARIRPSGAESVIVSQKSVTVSQTDHDTAPVSPSFLRRERVYSSVPAAKPGKTAPAGKGKGCRAGFPDPRSGCAGVFKILPLPINPVDGKKSGCSKKNGRAPRSPGRRAVTGNSPRCSGTAACSETHSGPLSRTGASARAGPARRTGSGIPLPAPGAASGQAPSRPRT